jgi:hypothetical protein
METHVGEQCCLLECHTTYRCSLIGTIVTFWKVWHRWIVRKLGLSIHVINCVWVGACAHASSWNSEFSSQEPDQLQYDCSLPHVTVQQYSSTIFVSWALISAINKLAHLINCCYVSSLYCIMRDYQTTWCHVPERSSHHCGNCMYHFNHIITYGQLCLIKQSCFQNVSCIVVLLPDCPWLRRAVHSCEIRGLIAVMIRVAVWNVMLCQWVSGTGQFEGL